MSREREATAVRVPWWRIATVALLGVALGLSLSSGHTWDAIIIAVLLLSAIALLAAAVWFQLKERSDSAGDI